MTPPSRRGNALPFTTPRRPMQPKPTHLLNAALAYAAAGWPVFPVTADKHPLTDHGFKDASTDPDQIRRWWARWPNAGIGFPTGQTSGIVALDLDRKHGDPDAMLDNLCAVVHADPPPTAVSLTGGGGKHLLFLCGDTRIKSSGGKIAPGVDVRGEGGYIVLPPSPHHSGGAYRWEHADGDVDTMPGTPAHPAAWLVRVLEAMHPVSLRGADTGTCADPTRDLGDVSWVAGALRYISADCSYSDWVRIAMALSEHPDGYELFDAWSASAPERYAGRDATARQWRGVLGKVRQVSLGTVWHAAAQNGWTPPGPRSIPPPGDADAPGWLTNRAEAPPDDLWTDADVPTPDRWDDVPLPGEDAPRAPAPVPWSLHVAAVVGFLDSARRDPESVAEAIAAGEITRSLGELAQVAPDQHDALVLRAREELTRAQAAAFIGAAKRYASDRVRKPARVRREAPPPEPGCDGLWGPYRVADLDGASWLVRVSEGDIETGQPPRVVRVCSPPVTVTGRVVQVTDQIECIRVEWSDGPVPRELILPRADAMTARSLSPHFGQGLPGTSNQAKEIVDYFAGSVARSNIPPERHTRVCGWHGKAFVRGEYTHGHGPAYVSPAGTETRVAAVREAGTLADWSAAVRDSVAEYPVLRLCMAAAVASPFLRLLGPTARPFIVDLCGDTGAGKTQMMQIALSTVGNPLEIHTNFADTAVALERHVEAFGDITVGIDETKRFNGPAPALSRLVYDLCGGRGKTRGTPTPGKTHRAAVFSSIMITTSEHPVASITGDGGLRSRCLTVQGMPWGGRSTRHAIRIQQLLEACMRNHGGPLRAVVDHIAGQTEAATSALRERWLLWVGHWRAAAQATHPHVEVGSRLAEYAATVCVAGEALAFVAGLPDTEWLTPELWRSILDRAESADRPRAALDLLCAQPATEPARWWSPSAPASEAPHQGWMGRARTDRPDMGSDAASEIVELAVLPDRLDALLTARGFTVEAVLAAWVQRKWIEPDGRNRARKMNLAGSSPRMIKLSPAALKVGQGLAAWAGETAEAE